MRDHDLQTVGVRWAILLAAILMTSWVAFCWWAHFHSDNMVNNAALTPELLKAWESLKAASGITAAISMFICLGLYGGIPLSRGAKEGRLDCCNRPIANRDSSTASDGYGAMNGMLAFGIVVLAVGTPLALSINALSTIY